MQLMTSENNELQGTTSYPLAVGSPQVVVADLTSLPTVMLAMTFLTASRLSFFFGLCSCCANSASSPSLASPCQQTWQQPRPHSPGMLAIIKAAMCSPFLVLVKYLLSVMAEAFDPKVSD